MNRTLLSLAIIKTNWEQLRKDYIENFVPLLASLIKKKKYREINLENINVIKKDFEEEYGLILPSSPILTILNRLSKRKLITRQHGIFIPNFKKINEIDISQKSIQLSREFEHVLKLLRKYVFEKHNISLEDIKLEDGLVGYLKKHDLDLLFAAENITLLPKVNTSKKIHYLINEFIIEVYKSEPEIFTYILNLTIGHALSSTILYKEFNSFSGNLKKLNIYLDTPFLFNLLGISGEYKKNLAIELVNILRQEKANLYILEITKGEIESNINEALRLLEKGKTDCTKGPLIFKNCIENNITVTDLENIYIQLPDTLERLDIKLDEVPSYNNYRKHQIDEIKLYNTIVDIYHQLKIYIPDNEDFNINFFKYLKKDKEKTIVEKKNIQIKEKKQVKSTTEKKDTDDDSKINNTIYRDVKVLSGIYRFRLGNKPKTLKDCKYLFITTNSSLAHASRKFEKIEYNQSFSLPTCLTDVFLGTLIWLQSPAQLKNINEKKIIADCYAAMKPSSKLITKYLHEIEKLKKEKVITDDQYYLLRTHRTAINILESKTLGDPDEFTSQTTREVLDELIYKIKKEEKDKLEKEIIEHDQTKRILQKERKKHKINKSKLYEIISAEEKRDKVIRSNIESKSRKKAKRVVSLCITIAIVILTISVLFQIINY